MDQSEELAGLEVFTLSTKMLGPGTSLASNPGSLGHPEAKKLLQVCTESASLHISLSLSLSLSLLCLKFQQVCRRPCPVQHLRAV